MNIHDYLTKDCIFFSDAKDNDTDFNLAVKRTFDHEMGLIDFKDF